MDTFQWGQLGLQLVIVLLTVAGSTVVMVSRVARVEQRLDDFLDRQDRMDKELDEKMSKELCNASHKGFRDRVEDRLQALKEKAQGACKRLNALEGDR
jgi:hypothetical protein